MQSVVKKRIRKWRFWPSKRPKFLPAAQPWWAAGCAVRGVGDSAPTPPSQGHFSQVTDLSLQPSEVKLGPSDLYSPHSI